MRLEILNIFSSIATNYYVNLCFIFFIIEIFNFIFLFISTGIILLFISTGICNCFSRE